MGSNYMYFPYTYTSVMLWANEFTISLTVKNIKIENVFFNLTD